MPTSVLVRAGASLDTLEPVKVNNDPSPTRIQSDAFDGYVMVRIRHWPQCHSAYFDHSSNVFCLQMVGRFLLPNLTADDIIFGNEFDEPVKLPMGSSIALKFAKWWDVGLVADLYAPQPYAYSPLIVTMNNINVQRGTQPTWLFGHGEGVDEDMSAVAEIPSKTSKARQGIYNAPQRRRSLALASDQIWSMEFANPYLDIGKCAVRLPGITIECRKYWEGQPLRYVAKTKDNQTIFFIIEFQYV